MEIVGTAHLLTVLGTSLAFVLLMGILAWQMVGRRGMTGDDGEYIGPPEYTSEVTTSLSTVNRTDASGENQSQERPQNPACDV